jgi:hypothetical protein
MNDTLRQNQASWLVFPVNGRQVYPGFSFSWDKVPLAESYLLEVSADSSFNSIAGRREVAEATFTADLMQLPENTTYFWRVYTRMRGVKDTVSEMSSFRLLQLPKVRLIYPQNDAAGVEVTPTIRWESLGEGFTYRMQISSVNTFTTLLADVTELQGVDYRLPAGIVTSYSTYFIRMQGAKSDTVTGWSDIVRFSTVRTPPAIPEIVHPLSGSQIEGQSAEVRIKTDPLASGYTFQWSSSSTFPWNNREQQSVAAPDSSLVLRNLASGTWFVRCRATYSSSQYTDWSPVVSFSMLLSDIPLTKNSSLKLQCPNLIGDEPLRIRFSLPERMVISLFLTDITGKTVTIARQGFEEKGEHETIIPSGKVPRGIHFVVLESVYEREVVRIIRM